MKKFLVKFGGAIATFALMITALNVNAACIFTTHQPELPKGSMNLRKF